MIPPDGLGQHHSGREIREEVIANYRGHHQFYWQRPRQTWFDAKCPVYIDFGEDLLYGLERYDETQVHCVRLVAKRKLIHDVMVERNAHDIAKPFYPVG